MYLPKFHVVFPFSFVARPIGIVERSLSLSHALYKVAIVGIPQRVLGASNTLQEPDVFAASMLKPYNNGYQNQCDVYLQFEKKIGLMMKDWIVSNMGCVQRKAIQK